MTALLKNLKVGSWYAAGLSLCVFAAAIFWWKFGYGQPEAGLSIPAPELPLRLGKAIAAEMSKDSVLIVHDFGEERAYFEKLDIESRHDYFLRRVIQAISEVRKAKFPSENKYKVFGILLQDKNEYGQTNWTKIKKILLVQVDLSRGPLEEDKISVLPAADVKKKFVKIEWLGAD